MFKDVFLWEWPDHLTTCRRNFGNWHICSTERICPRLCGMIFATSKITSVCAIGDVDDLLVDALAKSFSWKWLDHLQNFLWNLIDSQGTLLWRSLHDCHTSLGLLPGVVAAERRHLDDFFLRVRHGR